MKKPIFALIVLAVFGFLGTAGAAAAQSTGTLSISLTDKRRLFTRRLDKNRLLLRVVKDRSVNREHFCWNVEVVRRPYRQNSKNLIYTNPTGVTADPSQVCAWQAADRYFPNERELAVRGYPYMIKISLLGAKTEGEAQNAGFTSGTLQISWKRQP